jgi:hypothetical protein
MIEFRIIICKTLYSILNNYKECLYDDIYKVEYT